MYRHNFNILKGSKVIDKSFIELETNYEDDLDILCVVDEVQEMYGDNTLKIELVNIEELDY